MASDPRGPCIGQTLPVHVPHTVCTCGETYRCDDDKSASERGPIYAKGDVEGVRFHRVASTSGAGRRVRMVWQECPGTHPGTHSEMVLRDVPEQGLAGQPRAEPGACSCRSAAGTGSRPDTRTAKRRRMGRAARTPRHTARPAPHLPTRPASPGADDQPPDRRHRPSPT